MPLEPGKNEMAEEERLGLLAWEPGFSSVGAFLMVASVTDGTRRDSESSKRCAADMFFVEDGILFCGII